MGEPAEGPIGEAAHAVGGEHSHGLGLALRTAGVLFPLAAFWAIFLRVEGQRSGLPLEQGALRGFLRPLAHAWAWPYQIFAQQPLSFGLLALLAILLTAVLLARRDWRGASTVLAWSLFWGWLLATLMGQAQGS